MNGTKRTSQAAEQEDERGGGAGPAAQAPPLPERDSAGAPGEPRSEHGHACSREHHLPGVEGAWPHAPEGEPLPGTCRPCPRSGRSLVLASCRDRPARRGPAGSCSTWRCSSTRRRPSAGGTTSCRRTTPTTSSSSTRRQRARRRSGGARRPSRGPHSTAVSGPRGAQGGGCGLGERAAARVWRCVGRACVELRVEGGSATARVRAHLCVRRRSGMIRGAVDISVL